MGCIASNAIFGVDSHLPAIQGGLKCISRLVWGKYYRKASYLMGTSVVSGEDVSRENQSIESEEHITVFKWSPPSDIPSERYSDIFWHYKSGILSDMHSGILSGILSGIIYIYIYMYCIYIYILTFHLVFYLAFCLAFYLIYIYILWHHNSGILSDVYSDILYHGKKWKPLVKKKIPGVDTGLNMLDGSNPFDVNQRVFFSGKKHPVDFPVKMIRARVKNRFCPWFFFRFLKNQNRMSENCKKSATEAPCFDGHFDMGKKHMKKKNIRRIDGKIIGIKLKIYEVQRLL